MALVLYLFFLNAFLDAIIADSDGPGITIIVERKWESRNIQSRAETKNNHLSKARIKWDIFRFLDVEETIEGENRKMSKEIYPRIVQFDGQGIKSMVQLYQEPFCWQRGICHVDEESLISEYVLCGEYIKKDMKRCQKIDDKTIKRYATPSPKTRSSPGIINFAEGAPDESSDQEEISEGDQRRLCQYRVSCYEKMGFHHLIEKQRKKSGRGGAVFSAKLAPQPGKKRTLKQVAKMAVQEVKKKEANIETKKRLDQSDGETILAQYLSERERKIQCKYRKSCYKTGKVPEIEGSALLNWLGRTKEQEKDEEREEKKENKRKMMEGMDDYQQKLYCRYRPSCYVSGTRAEATEREWNWSEIELDFGIQQKFAECWSKLKKMVKRRKKPVESKDEEERSDGEDEKEDAWDDTQRKLECRYRKSCYESGELPEALRPVKIEKEEKVREGVMDGKRVPTSVKELKLFCKYRKSCYMTSAAAVKRSVEEDEVQRGKGMNKNETEKEAEERQEQLEIETTKKTMKNSDKHENIREEDRNEGKKEEEKEEEEREEKEREYKEQEEEGTEKDDEEEEEAKEEEKIEQKQKEEKEILDVEVKGKNKRIKKTKKEEGDGCRKKLAADVKSEESIVKMRPKMEKERKKRRMKKRPVIEVKNDEKKEEINEKMRKEEEINWEEEKGDEEKEQEDEERKEEVEQEEKKEEKDEEKEENKTQSVKKEKKQKMSKKKYQPQVKEKAEKAKAWSRKWEGLSKEQRLRCRYRKSCYATGNIPKGEEDWWGLATTEEWWNLEGIWALLPKLYEEKEVEEGKEKKWRKIEGWERMSEKEKMYKCKYRQSCYEAMEKKTAEELRRNEEIPKKTEEKKPKKAADMTAKVVARKADKQKKDEILRKEALYKSVDLDTKLQCRYRKSCYESSGSTMRAKSTITMAPRKNETSKITTLPEGQKCNQWRLSCREVMGLPIKEKAPIGPNGKKLCRKKKVDE